MPPVDDLPEFEQWVVRMLQSIDRRLLELEREVRAQRRAMNMPSRERAIWDMRTVPTTVAGVHSVVR